MMLKNKPQLVKFHESILVSLWNMTTSDFIKRGISDIYLEREWKRNRVKIKKQSDDFITKESRYNILVLVNLHQDFKMVKQVLLEQQWMFNKIQ